MILDDDQEDGFIDDGERLDGWLEVDETEFQQFYGSLNGWFPSKAHRDEALTQIMEARLEEEEDQRKEEEWQRLFGNDPPD